MHGMTAKQLQLATVILEEAAGLDLPYGFSDTPGCRMCVGADADWNVVVCRFGIEDQGFSPGSVGYAGAVRKGSVIVHMTRDVAERIFKKAEA